MGDAIENAVDKSWSTGIAEPMGQVHRLVNRDLGGDFSSTELVDPESENISFHHRNTAHAPILRGACYLRIERFHIRYDSSGKRFGPVQNPGLGAGETSQTAGDARDRWRSLQLPGIENLQRAGPALRLNP